MSLQIGKSWSARLRVTETCFRAADTRVMPIRAQTPSISWSAGMHPRPLCLQSAAQPPLMTERIEETKQFAHGLAAPLVRHVAQKVFDARLRPGETRCLEPVAQLIQLQPPLSGFVNRWHDSTPVLVEHSGERGGVSPPGSPTQDRGLTPPRSPVSLIARQIFLPHRADDLHLPFDRRRSTSQLG